MGVVLFWLKLCSPYEVDESLYEIQDGWTNFEILEILDLMYSEELVGCNGGVEDGSADG